jgi:hypothetical protein
MKNGTTEHIVDKPIIYTSRWGKFGLRYIFVADENLSFLNNPSIFKVV